jgi:hypothetical protein
VFRHCSFVASTDPMHPCACINEVYDSTMTVEASRIEG